MASCHTHAACYVLPQNTPNSQNLLLRCPPTDFSLGGYGILPYPRHLLWDILPQNTPNSQNLLLRRASHGFHRFTQILRVRCSPTEFTEYTEFGSVGMAGMHTLLHLCSSVSSVGVLSLQEVLCIRCIPWELLHRLFGWCSSCSGKRQSRAETAVPPGGIHGSSVQISPFHLEPSLLYVLPVLWVRLRHHLRLVDAQPGEHDGSRRERHRHAVVVVGVDRL